MKHLRTLLRWWGLMNKRLLKRPGFWAILLAVPLLVLALTLAAANPGGVVRIAVGLEAPEDPAAAAAADRITGGKSVLELVRCADAEEARTLVSTGRADGAWIFPTDYAQCLEAAAAGEETCLVTVVEKEDSVLLRLSREKLFAALYPDLIRALFQNFAETQLGESSPGEIARYYSLIHRNSRFIEFADADGARLQPAEGSFLVTPVRGILALLILMGALVSALYYTREQEAFVWLKRRKRMLMPFFCHMILILDLSVPVALALGLSGLVTFWPWEILLLLLYGLSCAGFAEVLRGLLGTAGRLGAALPLVLLAGLALCPIFLNVHRLPAVQILLPPFYYLNGAHSGRFAAYLALYAACSWGLGILLQTIGRKRVQPD